MLRFAAHFCHFNCCLLCSDSILNMLSTPTALCRRMYIVLVWDLPRASFKNAIIVNQNYGWLIVKAQCQWGSEKIGQFFLKATEFIKENKYTKIKTVVLWATRVSYSECSLCIKDRWWWGVYILSSSFRKNQLDQLTWNVTWCLLRLPHRNYIMNAKVPTVLVRIFCPNGNFFTNHEDFSDFTSIIALWEKTIRCHLTP